MRAVLFNKLEYPLVLLGCKQNEVSGDASIHFLVYGEQDRLPGGGHL